MKPSQLLKSEIERGKRGENRGISMGLPGLDTLIGGIPNRGRYDVVFADEGCGKTAFVDHAYVLYPMLYGNTDFNYKVIYYSLEISYLNKIAKWLAWMQFKEQKFVTSVTELLSKGKHTIKPESEKFVEEVADSLDKLLENKITLYAKSKTPTEMNDDIKSFMREFGQLRTDFLGNSIYTPNDEKLIVTVIIDTASDLELQKIGDVTDERVTLNYLSKIIKNEWRNVYGINTVLVMHTNRNSVNIGKGKYDDVFPKKSDAAISSLPIKNADTAIALFNPLEHATPSNGMFQFMDYEIPLLNEMFRAYGLLKNRDGPAPRRGGFVMVPSMGFFRELPPAPMLSKKNYEELRLHKKLTLK